MSFYADMATTARTLIAEYGQTISVKRTTGGSVDPVTGVVVAGTTTTYSPKGILRKYADKLIDGTRIKASDRELVLDDTVAPVMTDKVTIGGQDWVLKAITPVEPAGTPLVYFCQVSK